MTGSTKRQRKGKTKQKKSAFRNMTFIPHYFLDEREEDGTGKN